MNEEKIALERTSHYTVIEDPIIDDERVGQAELLVYLALARHAGKSRECWPGWDTIAREARCSRSRVPYYIESLGRFGYVEKLGKVPHQDRNGRVRNFESYRLPALIVPKPRRGQQQDGRVVSPETTRNGQVVSPGKTGGLAGGQEVSPFEVTPEKEGGSLPFLATLLEEAKRLNVTTLWLDSAFVSRLKKLANEVPRELIIIAFRACLTVAPDRAPFFPADFEKWRKKATDLRLSSPARAESSPARAPDFIATLKAERAAMEQDPLIMSDFSAGMKKIHALFGLPDPTLELTVASAKGPR